MTTSSDKRSWETVRAAAEQILSEVFREKVQIGETKHIGGNRSAVFRCTLLDGPDEAPTSVVAKQAMVQKGEIYDPDAHEGPAWRLFNEWAGLQFLGFFNTVKYGGEDNLTLFSRQTPPVSGKNAEKHLRKSGIRYG